MIKKIESKEQLAPILMKNGFKKYEEVKYGFFKNEIDVCINKNGVLCIFNKKNGSLKETGVQEIVFDISEITGETWL